MDKKGLSQLMWFVIIVIALLIVGRLLGWW